MAVNCDDIRAEIDNLEVELADLQDALATASPQEKPDLIRRITEIQGTELPDARQRLKECLGT